MSDDEFEEKKAKTGAKARTTGRKEKYGALVMVINCGETMNEMEDGRSHFSMAKEAADWILSRKIFTQSKDKVSIVLFGTEETKNNLDLPNICVQDEVLSRISFDHLRFLNREVSSNSKFVGSAVDALVVAADYLHQQTEGDAAVQSKNILLFTNGLAKCHDDKTKVSALINGLNAMEATLVVIGVDSDSAKGHGKEKAPLLDIVKRTEGMSYGFKDAVSVVHHFTTPVVDSRAIRKNWEIAPGVRLPLAMYTKSVAAKNPLKSVLVNEEGTEMHRQSRFISAVKSNDGATESNPSQFVDLTEKEKRIQVYYFGDTKVPIEEEDETRYNRHNFNEGEQRGCMKLIQFTKRENIKECYFIGRNSFVVVPGWEKKTSERDLEAMPATMSLISAMLENDVVAICRYAPDAAKHLQLMALIPHRDEELDMIYLQALRLPFAEDMRPFNFVNVSESCPKPNHKQVNLIDELIDVMQFNTENGCMDPECVLNPFFQRQCTAMKLKVFNNIKNEDSKIADLIAPSLFLKRGLEPSEELLKKAEHVLNAVGADDTGFNLQEVVKAKRIKQEIRQEDISEWLAELEAVQEDSKPSVEIKKRPQNRFIDRARARLSDNFEFHMSSLLEEVVVMVSAEDEEAEQLYEIARGRIASLRSLAIEFGKPNEFNEWLLFSKTQWPEWARFCASKGGDAPILISSSECSASEYSEKESAALWKGCN
ncbi:hypothetical protein V3C99_004488 [Haemonchus contortus]